MIMSGTMIIYEGESEVSTPMALTKEMTRKEEMDALRAELIDSEEHYIDAKKKLATLEQTEYMYNESIKIGTQLKAAMQGFVDAGFTEEQAYELLLVTIDKTV